MSSGPIDYSDRYKQLIAYNDNNQTLYVGLAAPGARESQAVWQIKKWTWEGTNLVSIKFADGNTAFDNIWDNRATLSYD